MLMKDWNFSRQHLFWQQYSQLGYYFTLFLHTEALLIQRQPNYLMYLLIFMSIIIPIFNIIYHADIYFIPGWCFKAERWLIFR